MAYGVKYQLIFSDFLGNGKKVEILKKDYTGEVLPMIAGKNPVQISWQSSDDFYKPIVGSKCLLSLLVTDSVTYDDFYKFDEREYKVVVSYAKSQGEIFSERVEADGGTCESIECVENVLKPFETISTYYDHRVVEDGGTVESLDCVSNAITDNNFYHWDAYWSGFLVVDRYKEKLTTPPFAVTFNAFDGLGTLDSFDAPVTYDYTPSVPVYKSDAERISEILSNLDLDLDLCFINDIESAKISGNPTNKYFPNTVTIKAGFNELTDGYDIPNAKEQLANILTSYNMRIFQSLNKWYIVEVTNLFDINVKNAIYNELQSTGSVPTQIRTKISNQLFNTSKEFIKTYNYNYLGNFISQSLESLMYKAPKDLKPVNKDLSIEFIPPKNSVLTTPIIQNFTKSGYNSGFEYGLNDYTVFNNYAEIAVNEISLQGDRAIKLSSSAPTSSQTNCFQLNDVTFTDFNDIENYDFICNYYLKKSGIDYFGTSATIQFRIRFEVASNPSDFYEWDFANENWSYQSVIFNTINETDYNQFKNFEIEFNKDNITWFPSVGNCNLKIFILNTATLNPTYETTYFDNIELLNNSAIKPIQSSLETIINDGSFYTTKKEFKRLNTDFISRQDNAYFRTRDNFGTLVGSNLYKNLTTIQNQNFINDFREFVTRYQGTFVNLKTKPLSFLNRIWFNWSDSDYDEQSSVIDSLKYNVKDAEFYVKAHLPNDDDDVSVEIKIT